MFLNFSKQPPHLHRLRSYLDIWYDINNFNAAAHPSPSFSSKPNERDVTFGFLCLFYLSLTIYVSLSAATQLSLFAFRPPTMLCLFCGAHLPAKLYEGSSFQEVENVKTYVCVRQRWCVVTVDSYSVAHSSEFRLMGSPNPLPSFPPKTKRSFVFDLLLGIQPRQLEATRYHRYARIMIFKSVLLERWVERLGRGETERMFGGCVWDWGRLWLIFVSTKVCPHSLCSVQLEDSLSELSTTLMNFNEGIYIVCGTVRQNVYIYV